ncbi:bifunctional nuclease family protein [Aestuariimicrobium ganziense]|uniref:bifunctional nuclease family protein n=1 Tax=Aestuariimicrobium ganziense TaxID=2773677 RepID=UPI001942959C|nr:bifunctional nuclease family protein [Aestuariimicrobium ganziense]
MRELEVVGVRLDVSNAPILVLREQGGRRCLPIWIGANEAAAIVNALEGVVPPRPMTHDLLVTVLRTLGVTQTLGRIDSMDEGTYTASMQLGEHWIQVRPSDLAAIAVRTGMRLECSEELVDEIGVVLDEDGGDDEMEKFREFLDSVTPEDFEGGEPGAEGSTSP